MLNVYFTFAKPNSHITVMSSPFGTCLDILQLLHSHVAVMSKYSNAKFECLLDKFFTFSLRSWQ